MPDLLQSGATMLRDTLQANVAHDVTYFRPGALGGTVTLPATIGQQVYKTITEGRQRYFRSDRDFIIDPLKLVINGVQVDPQEGDRVTDGSDVFVVTILNGEPCFRKVDGFNLLIRVHTMRRKVPAA